MALTFAIKAVGISKDERRMLRTEARIAHALYKRLCDEASLPMPRIELSLEASVELIRGENVSGDATNIGDDWSAAMIRFDLSGYPLDATGAGRTYRVFVLAHELAHPVLFRASELAGTPVVSPFDQNISTRDMFRTRSLILAHEYRADMLAHPVAQSVLGTDEYYPWTFIAPNVAQSLSKRLHIAAIEWPTMLAPFRATLIDRMIPPPALVFQLWHLLEEAVHLYAYSRPSEGTPFEHFGVATTFARRHFAEPIERFMEVVRSRPPLPPISEISTFEKDIMTAGDAMVRRILKTFGLTG
ncbi:MAG: hypothetical protein ACYDAR_04410 [Thermomicrobiales bacterium]